MIGNGQMGRMGEAQASGGAFVVRLEGCVAMNAQVLLICNCFSLFVFVLIPLLHAQQKRVARRTSKPAGEVLNVKAEKVHINRFP